MLISCAWLNELLVGAPIRLSPVVEKGELGPARVAEILTSLGLEVDGIRHHELPGIIVGEIREVSPHPKADKLHVVSLFDGDQVVSVVCGASNLPPAGGKVAFAPVGVTLPGGLEIGARELRGVESRGMICSEDELDIGADHSGILVLPRDWPAGAALADQIPGIVDSVIEISVTPNRPDALGHIGVAIDLGVALGVATRTPAIFDPSQVPVDESLVTQEAPERCGRYLGYALDQVEVGSSPPWMRVRLHRVGLRAINDVVDITNYVLMETGQPLHAFDRAKLREGRVVVRTARAGEPMTTLDETTIELRSDDLVIADAEAPQALAGVMGGSESMVEGDSTTLLLEIAWFEPRGIRRSARRHGFHTDSSHRFERGVDHGGKLELAAKRALELLRELCRARCVGRHEVVGERPETPTIALRPARIGALLGMEIQDAEAARILAGLGVRVARAEPAEGAPASWSCVPPSFRPDLLREVDLVEEVMRHHGLDDLPAVHTQSSEFGEPIPGDPVRERADAICDALWGAGLHEHVSVAFSAPDAFGSVPPPVPAERLVHLRNPMRVQASIMRSHLLPGLLDAVALNHARHDRALALFEIGRIYFWSERELGRSPEVTGPTAAVDRHLPEEPTRVGLIRAARADDESGQSRIARAVIEDLVQALGALGHLVEARPAPTLEPWLHPGVQIGLWLDEVQVGVAGELHPDLIDGRDLAELEIAYGELWIERWLAPPEFGHEELPRFPDSARDLSLDLADEVPAAQVVAALRRGARASEVAPGSGGPDGTGTGPDPVRLSSSADTRQAIEMLEDYRGEGVDEGRRALLVRLHYRAMERSVTDAEVQQLHDAVIEEACAELREIDPALRVR